MLSAVTLFPILLAGCGTGWPRLSTPLQEGRPRRLEDFPLETCLAVFPPEQCDEIKNGKASDHIGEVIIEGEGDKGGQLLGQQELSILAGYAIAIIVSIVVACQYKAKVVDARGMLQDVVQHLNGDGFRVGLFGCLGDCQTCLHAFFFPACRAGDSFSAIGASSYCWAIAAFLAADVAGLMLSGVLVYALRPSLNALEEPPLEVARMESMVQGWCQFLVTGLILAAVFSKDRATLRVRLGGDPKAASGLADFCAWLLCTSCAVAQEAREVDAAMGVRVECCCQLKQASHPLVGQATYATARGRR